MLKRILVILFTLAVLGIGGVVAFDYFLGNHDPSITPINLKNVTPSQIVETSARSFFVVDYNKPTAWLETMRPLASEEGNRLLRDVVAPALWPDFQRLQTKVEAKQVHAADKGKVLSGYSQTAKTDWEIHVVQVTLDSAVKWPGKTGAFETYILINKTPDGWRFTSFLADEMVKQLAEAQGLKSIQTPTK